MCRLLQIGFTVTFFCDTPNFRLLGVAQRKFSCGARKFLCVAEKFDEVQEMLRFLVKVPACIEIMIV